MVENRAHDIALLIGNFEPMFAQVLPRREITIFQDLGAPIFKDGNEFPKRPAPPAFAHFKTQLLADQPAYLVAHGIADVLKAGRRFESRIRESDKRG